MLKIDPKSLGAFEKRTPGPRYSGFLRNLPTKTTVLLRGLYYDYVEKADLSKGYQNRKENWG